VFEQQACLAPQVLLVEGESREVESEAGFFPPLLRLARALAQALIRLEARLPARTLSTSEQVARRGLISMLELESAMGGEPVLISKAEHLQGVVTLEKAPSPVSRDGDLSAWRSLLKPCPMDRFVRIVQVEDWRHLQPVWDESGCLLQNVAVLGADPELSELKARLAQAGCSRICLPGQMATPSMMWQHDGVPRLGELVRWCDEELLPPG